MQLIDELYKAFANVPKATLSDGCMLGCCMTKEDRETVLQDPLRTANSEILWFYPSDAIWTVGTKLDFKYFVPRLLDLGLRPYHRDGAQQNFFAFPVTFGKKLNLANFNSWTEAQRKVVSDAIFEIFRSVVLGDDFYDIDSWIIVTCYIAIDKERFFTLLDSPEGAKARNYFLLSVRGEYSSEGISGPHWDELNTEQIKDVYLWLVSREKESDQALSEKRKRDRWARGKVGK